MTNAPIETPVPLPLGDRRQRLSAGLRLALAAARKELVLVIALFVAAAGIVAFLSLWDAVEDGHTARFDLGLILALRQAADPSQPIGPAWLKTAIIDFTALGSITVLAAVVLIVAGLFVAIRRWREALVLLVAPASGLVLVNLVKDRLARPRPPLILHVIPVTQASFPSGHAALSATVYLTLATLVAHFAERRRVRLYALSVGVILAVLVGASRIYLGVHWPTDVLAGWAMGAAWATLWWMLAWVLEARHGRLTRPTRLDKAAL
ncbi:MAG TPA: phosphatase PAP2 family protein [Caulobacteraceae bacterium]|nr:phosphatase PAP2 family protein [Caulobacteraceae bacterium]